MLWEGSYFIFKRRGNFNSTLFQLTRGCFTLAQHNFRNYMNQKEILYCASMMQLRRLLLRADFVISAAKEEYRVIG